MSLCRAIKAASASRPTRARGLKHGADPDGIAAKASRPTRARGLKHLSGILGRLITKSRPTRARGLKRGSGYHAYRNRCRAPRGRVD